MFDLSWKEIILMAFSGVGTALVTGVVCKRINSRKVSQKNLKAGGDIAGGNITKRK